MENLFAVAVATAILVLIPGPNVALIVANSLRYGLHMGLITVFGTTTGIALQLALVVLGMAAIIEIAAEALSWIRWAGVAYLIWLGIRTWREPSDDLRAVAPAPAVFWRGATLAAINPKTLLFNAAFLPQFVPAGTESAERIVLVAAVFLAVIWAGDVLWATFANSVRPFIVRCGHWHHRLTGGFLVTAGFGLVGYNWEHSPFGEVTR